MLSQRWQRMRRILCSVLLLMIPLVSNQPQDHTADLWEAFEIASAEAVKWDASAQPYFITSVDDGIESEAVKGQNGIQISISSSHCMVKQWSAKQKRRATQTGNVSSI